MANTAVITLQQIFRYYKALPHQAAAISLLEQDLAANGYTVAMRRDRPWFEAWSQDGRQIDLSSAIQLIKEFEGCHLTAYPDPLSGGAPWTIGYGTTRYSRGEPVKQNDRINIIEADMLLRLEVDRIAENLSKTVPYWREMQDHQRCALISFAYNLGRDFCGAAGFETISKRLADRSWTEVPAAMLLYRNPGTNVEAGLRRRREAEGKLWTGMVVQQGRFMPNSSFALSITPHIAYGEFALEQEDRRFDHLYQCVTAMKLAEFLERVRTQFDNKPLVITSGYRPPKINKAIGGASNSEHLYSGPGVGAVDFYVQGADINAVQAWCDKHWPFSLGYGAPKGFVHLGMRAGGPRVRWDY